MGLGRGQGFGMGNGLGAGQGYGPRPDAPESETGRQPTRLRGPHHKGKMLSSYLEKGEAPTGDAQVELLNLILEGQRIAEQSLERERIPAELKEIPIQYFEKIQGQQ